MKTSALLRILQKNGFVVDKSKGKGSHAKLYGKDGKMIIIPKSLEAPSVRSSIGRFLVEQGVNLDEMFQ